MDDLAKADAVLADKAYDGDERGAAKPRKKWLYGCDPTQKNRLNPPFYDKNLYTSRHLIENFFAKLKQYRAIATRYDKTSKNFQGAIHLALIVLWLN